MEWAWGGIIPALEGEAGRAEVNDHPQPQSIKDLPVSDLGASKATLSYTARLEGKEEALSE